MERRAGRGLRQRTRVAVFVVGGAASIGAVSGVAHGVLSGNDAEPSVVPNEQTLPNESLDVVPPRNSGVPSGTLPDGRTYGPVPHLVGGRAARSDAMFAAMPDMVSVLGDGGKRGYADAHVVFGDDGIGSPEEATEAMNSAERSSGITTPVLNQAGEQIDVLTIK